MVGSHDVEKLNITELKQLIIDSGLTFDDCIEKSELRERATQALRTRQGPAVRQQHVVRRGTATRQGVTIACALLYVHNSLSSICFYVRSTEITPKKPTAQFFLSAIANKNYPYISTK